MNKPWIGLLQGLGPTLLHQGNEKLFTNVMSRLDLDDKIMAEFEDAVRQYDALPRGHDTRKKAPYDLVHSSYSDVVAYYNMDKSSPYSKAA